MSITLQEIERHWTAIRPLFLIRDEEEYDQAVAVLNDLIDLVGSNEDHILAELMELLGSRIGAYEEENYPIPAVSGATVSRYALFN